MSLPLRSTATTATGAALIGIAAYAVYKSGILRPVMVGTVKAGVKAVDWAEKQYAKTKDQVKGLVAEARKDAAPAK